jgi:hypothetical protein
MVFKVIHSYKRSEYAMSEDKIIALKNPGAPTPVADALTEVLREGAQRMLVAAIEKVRFTSAILPSYLRRTKSLEELLPWLYLKGLSTGDFQEALTALLGGDAPGSSASTISRLKEACHVPYDYLPRRRYALFEARSLLQDIFGPSK